ncbi:MAG: GerMN domain-containing protein [Desulfobacterales bacterium]
MPRSKRPFPVSAAWPAVLFLILQLAVFLPDAGCREPEEPVFLYFADPETGYLAGEPRRIEPSEENTAFYAKIAEALLAGPEKDLDPVFPNKTELLAIYEVSDKTVFVDLSDDAAIRHPRGVRSELLSVYSIVNTLVLNCRGIEAVKILVEGNETETLAGHVDISRPLKARILLVR